MEAIISTLTQESAAMTVAINTVWVLLAAILVFWMQAGFSMVEAGLTRAKNAGNIIMKNLMDFSIGSLVFYLIGFSLMFGADAGGLIGVPSFLSSGSFEHLGLEIPKYAFIIFQTVFAATASTIVSGAMAERTKFISYAMYAVFICLVIYPVSGHWVWGGGWLSQLGFHDFAGSTVVHSVGGWTALVGAAIIGPRIGKYAKNGKPNAIAGHSITLAALGVFILWMGWFGFNAGSTLSGMDVDSISLIFMTTNIAAAAGAFVTMALTWVKFGKPDVSMTLNGALAGLVAITAGCDIVSINGALIIGIIAAFVVTFGIGFVDKVLKIDDPVGAIGVHGLSGAAGTLLVGLFATDGGLFYGGGAQLLGIQALGVVAVFAWTVVASFIMFKLIDKTIGLRISKEEERRGLDITEHGLQSSYADFQTIQINA